MMDKSQELQTRATTGPTIILDSDDTRTVSTEDAPTATPNVPPTLVEDVKPPTTTTNDAHLPSPATPSPSSSVPTDPFSDVWLKMEKAMNDVKSRPIELPVEFIISCTNNFDKDRKIGEGAFGVVYKGEYDNRVFTVKHIADDIAVKKDELQEKTVSNLTNVKTELEVSSFVVSNIACF
jgi:hypothetical protein